MRMIKCDMCGHVFDADDDEYIQVSMSYSSNGRTFDCYEICEDCLKDLSTILIDGVKSHSRHLPE